MADYSNSKKAGAGNQTTGAQAQVYPVDCVTRAWGALEPVLTPDQLKSRFLKGIPMQLRIKDPDNQNRPYRFTDEELKDYIHLALNEAEEEAGITIMPAQYLQRLPFSKADYYQFGYFRLDHKPCSSIEALQVSLADNSQVFSFPLQWVLTSNLIRGQLNILPLAFEGTVGGTGVVGGVGAGSGTAVFFNALWNRPWVPALFDVQYTAGFPDGNVPTVVNQYIGTIAAQRVLSQIAAAYAHVTSASLGADGLSQSVGLPGPQRYQIRIQELQTERDGLKRKIRRTFGASFVTGSLT